MYLCCGWEGTLIAYGTSSYSYFYHVKYFSRIFHDRQGFNHKIDLVCKYQTICVGGQVGHGVQPL